MFRTRIKICGVTCAEDAAMAAEAGADAIGMVFHAAARRGVTMETARGIVDALRPFVTPVGLFVDAPAEGVRQTCGELGIGCAQLNGHESPEDVAALAPLRVVKAIRVEAVTLAGEIERWREAIARLGLGNFAGVVLEPGGTKQAGGTGIANDWDLVERHRAALAEVGPVIAAGGLRPETVGEVVRRMRPFAVDVSSGVEVEYGRKSAELVRRFIAEVRRGDA